MMSSFIDQNYQLPSMEKPDDYSMAKELPAPSDDSSWASYIADFVATRKEKSTSSGSSLVVCDAWKPEAHFDPPKACKKPSLKKRKTRGGMDDDPLEDTASSPVKSPQVGVSDQLHMKPRKTEESRWSSKIDVSFVDSEQLRTEIDEMNSPKNLCGATDLRKKGLCLVPLSMVMNYLE